MDKTHDENASWRPFTDALSETGMAPESRPRVGRGGRLIEHVAWEGGGAHSVPSLLLKRL